MKIIYLIIIFVFIILFKNIESFSPNEIITKYIPFGNTYCLVTKNITANGGTYSSEIKSGNIPPLFDNQKAILINSDFNQDTCINKHFGSGRKRGGFECIDFITKKMAKKYNLEFSTKTCFDKLNFVPHFPDYKNQINN